MVFIIAVLLCLSLAPAALGQGFLSLRLPADARQAALGGYHPADDGGPASLRANPANLSSARWRGLAASHRSFGLGLRGEWVGGYLPWGGWNLAADATMLHAGEMPRYDASGTPLGSFSPREASTSFGAAHRLAGPLLFGVAARWLHLQGTDEQLTGWAADAGFALDLGSVRLGVCARNIGPSPSANGASYPLPSEIGFGVRQTWRWGTITTLSVSAPLGRASAPYIALGGELVRVGPAALLGGCGFDTDGLDAALLPSAGVELTVGGLQTTYAYSADASGTPGHHLSVCFARTRGDGSDGGAQASVGPHESGRHVPAPGPSDVEIRYSVWGGTHRDARGADAEVRALDVEGFRGAEVRPTSDGRYRVRVAHGLAREAADALALRLHGSVTAD